MKLIDQLESEALDWPAFAERVEDAIASESMPVMEEFLHLLSQQDEERKAHPRILPNGEPDDSLNAWQQWLWLVKEGYATLPKQIPHEVVLAWRDRFPYIHPSRRCNDCGMALPGNYWQVCPVCQSEELLWADLSQWAPGSGGYIAWNTGPNGEGHQPIPGLAEQRATRPPALPTPPIPRPTPVPMREPAPLPPEVAITDAEPPDRKIPGGEPPDPEGISPSTVIRSWGR
jgi:hypothetical protein